MKIEDGFDDEEVELEIEGDDYNEQMSENDDDDLEEYKLLPNK